MLAWFPISNGRNTAPRKQFSESELRSISDILRRTGKESWSRIPRIYSVLRTINQLEAIEVFLSQGLSDVGFPFTHKTLPEGMRSPSVRYKFLEAQQLVLCKALDLEREAGEHRHFSEAAELPFIKVGDLGKGGYSYVDRVVSTISHREYARKLIPRGRTFKKDYEVLKSFEKELRNLKKLSHPHIIELIGSYTDPRFVGIIMSPVADCNLRDFLNPGPSNFTGQLSLLRNFFGCLAAALCYLHENCIRHKDIKPANILVKDHQVYLADFGISLDWTELGESTTLGPSTAITHRYCAPEVAELYPRNSSSDLWSLGCVFLEIWTVIKGLTIADLIAHLERSDTMSTYYYLNYEGVLTWLSTVSEKAGVPSDNAPQSWIFNMLKIDRKARWSARNLLDSIQEVNRDVEVIFNFSGLCCIEDLEFPESVHSTDSDGEADVSHPLTIRIPPVHSKMVDQYSPSKMLQRLESPTDRTALLQDNDILRQKCLPFNHPEGHPLNIPLTEVDHLQAFIPQEGSTLLKSIKTTMMNLSLSLLRGCARKREPTSYHARPVL